MKSMIFLVLAKIFAHLQYLFHETVGINLRGFGTILSQIKGDFVLSVGRRNVYFNHKIARAYGRLIGGIWNEPETHRFLKKVMDRIDFKVNFVDVGASVGEFVIDMAGYERTNQVFAFEPIYEACKSVRLSCIINEYENVNVINQSLNEDGSPLTFYYNKKSPTGSNIFETDEGRYMVESTTLDNEFLNHKEPFIILLDCEGAEWRVLKGGVNFLKKISPLIIFEYNEVSRKYFSLKQVQDVLGKKYEIYRLRGDGLVDKNYENTWNMVAVSSDSSFYPVIKSMTNKG